MTYDYVIGMDVGKYFHHACVLDIDGAQVLSKRINQNEKSLRTLFSTFSANNHKVLIVVDQPNNIGRLTVAVAQDIGIDVRYLPGLAMRQLSRIHAGNAKTDIWDAYIIAHAGKNLPESLRSVDRAEEAFLQLKVLGRHRRRLSTLLHQAHQSDSKCTSWLLPAIRTSPSRPDNPPHMGSAPPCTLRRAHQNKEPRKSQSNCLCSTL